MPFPNLATGTDFSVNAAPVPMNGLVLLLTVPVTASRSYIEVQNQSAALLQLVRDDGYGGNQTSILLSSGGSAGAQGAGWTSSTFSGRVRIYGPAGAQVSVYQE